MKNIFLGILAFLSLSIILLTGERMNFIIRIGAGIISIISCNFKIKKALYFTSIVSLLFALLLLLYPPMTQIYKTFINKIPIINMEKDNPYWESWRGGLQQGLENPIIGLGVASYREHCSSMNSNNVEWYQTKSCVNIHITFIYNFLQKLAQLASY